MTQRSLSTRCTNPKPRRPTTMRSVFLTVPLLLFTAHAARATHIVLARATPRLFTRAQELGIALLTPAQALQVLDGTAV